jgi:hypothetical protein
MLQRRAEATRATRVACAFRATGEVTLTSLADVAAVGAANAAAAAKSAAIPASKGTSRFTWFFYRGPAAMGQPS